MATHAYSTPAPEDGAHHRSRRTIEAHIEWLIALLDDQDGDSDLELDCDTEEGDTDRVGSLTVDDEPDQDEEPALGWPESHCFRLSHEGMFVQAQGNEEEHTALERHGAGFARSGPDDAEDSHDAEAVDEDGSDTGPWGDNGIADGGGAAEQFFGFGFIGHNVEMTCDMPGGDVLGADQPVPTAWGARL